MLRRKKLYLRQLRSFFSEVDSSVEIVVMTFAFLDRTYKFREYNFAQTASFYVLIEIDISGYEVCTDYEFISDDENYITDIKLMFTVYSAVIYISTVSALTVGDLPYSVFFGYKSMITGYVCIIEDYIVVAFLSDTEFLGRRIIEAYFIDISIITSFR